MAKLTLRVNDLTVESFHTVPDASAKGTVVAAEYTVILGGGVRGGHLLRPGVLFHA